MLKQDGTENEYPMDTYEGIPYNVLGLISFYFTFETTNIQYSKPGPKKTDLLFFSTLLAMDAKASLEMVLLCSTYFCKVYEINPDWLFLKTPQVVFSSCLMTAFETKKKIDPPVWSTIADWNYSDFLDTKLRIKELFSYHLALTPSELWFNYNDALLFVKPILNKMNPSVKKSFLARVDSNSATDLHVSTQNQDVQINLCGEFSQHAPSLDIPSKDLGLAIHVGMPSLNISPQFCSEPNTVHSESFPRFFPISYYTRSVFPKLLVEAQLHVPTNSCTLKYNIPILSDDHLDNKIVIGPYDVFYIVDNLL